MPIIGNRGGPGGRFFVLRVGRKLNSPAVATITARMARMVILKSILMARSNASDQGGNDQADNEEGRIRDKSKRISVLPIRCLASYMIYT